MVTLRNLLLVAGVIAVLSLLAAVGSFLVAVWAILQIVFMALGLGSVFGFVLAHVLRRKK